MQPHLYQDPVIEVLSGGVDAGPFCSCAAFPPAGHPNKPEVVSIVIFADKRTTAVTLQQRREGGFRWCQVATGSTRAGSFSLPAPARAVSAAQRGSAQVVGPAEPCQGEGSKPVG